MERRVGTAVLRLVGALLLGTAVVALVRPLPMLVTYRPVVDGGLAVAVIAGGWFVLRSDAAHPLRRAAAHRAVPTVVGLVAVFLSTTCAWLLQYDYGWDARAVMTIARLVEAGSVSDLGYAYLSQLPNVIPLVAIDRGALAVASWLPVSGDEVMLLVNGLCLAATLAGVHHLLSRLAGRGWSTTAQVALTMLVGLSPWLAVPYTDMLAMPFLTWGVVLAVLARPAGRPACWWPLVASGALIGIAYALKTTPVAAAVAVGLALLVQVATGPARVRLLSAASVLVFGFAFVAVSALADRAAWDLSGVDRDRVDTSASPPLVWWVANGMSEQVAADGRVAYGTYDRSMVRAITGMSQPEMRDWSRQYISTRWTERGLAGSLGFYGNKQAANWGDAMFSAWMEGADSLASPRRDSAATRFVSSWNAPRGAVYQPRAELAQALWLALLLVGGIALLRVGWRPELVTLALATLGIAAFTLLFQGRARYLLAYVPVLVATVVVAVSRCRRARPGPDSAGRLPDRGE